MTDFEFSYEISRQRKEIKSKMKQLFKEIAKTSYIQTDFLYDDSEKLNDIQTRISQIHQLIGKDKILLSLL